MEVGRPDAVLGSQTEIAIPTKATRINKKKRRFIMTSKSELDRGQ
jgi:hypothetical protein